MTRIVLATGNAGKIAEFRGLLAGAAVEFVPQSELGVTDVPETATSFVENALIKARNAAVTTGLPALADDSGLEVDALDGAPGVYSARFAGPEANDESNIALLLERLKEVGESHRRARFHCLLVCLRHRADPTPLICHGVWEGQILDAPRGEGGFGYDPVFLVPDLGCTAAQMDPETKNRLSHRGQAMAKLAARLVSFLPSPEMRAVSTRAR